jgi:hypothetical protein
MAPRGPLQISAVVVLLGRLIALGRVRGPVGEAGLGSWAAGYLRVLVRFRHVMAGARHVGCQLNISWSVSYWATFVW